MGSRKKQTGLPTTRHAIYAKNLEPTSADLSCIGLVSALLTFLLYQYLRPPAGLICSHWSASRSFFSGTAGGCGPFDSAGGGGGLPAGFMSGFFHVVTPVMALCQYGFPSPSLSYLVQFLAWACVGAVCGGRNGIQAESGV